MQLLNKGELENYTASQPKYNQGPVIVQSCLAPELIIIVATTLPWERFLINESPECSLSSILFTRENVCSCVCVHCGWIFLRPLIILGNLKDAPEWVPDLASFEQDSYLAHLALYSLTAKKHLNLWYTNWNSITVDNSDYKMMWIDSPHLFLLLLPQKGDINLRLKNIGIECH